MLDGARPCHLDEGSPLVQIHPDSGKSYVVGIVTKNLGCRDYLNEDLLYPSIYTRLWAFAEWIIEHANIQNRADEVYA